MDQTGNDGTEELGAAAVSESTLTEAVVHYSQCSDRGREGVYRVATMIFT